MARGENGMGRFVFYNPDGTPYILPPLDDEARDLNVHPVLCLTVRTFDGYNIIFTKYCDLFGTLSAIVDDVVMLDINELGFNKFISQEIKETNQSTLTLDFARSDIDENKYYVYHSIYDGTDIYQYILQNDKLAQGITVVPYNFDIGIVFDHLDTTDLDSKEYIYDIILYYGIIKDKSVYNGWYDEDPFEKVFYKKQLLKPHKLILEDSNNA